MFVANMRRAATHAILVFLILLCLEKFEIFKGTEKLDTFLLIQSVY